MDRGRPGARRGDHGRDRRAGRRATRPPTASSSTAFRAPSPRPRRSTRRWRSSARELTAAILIEVPDEEVVRRLGGRRTCVKEGHIFHVEFDPPKNEGVCDICGAGLIVRDDDKPEVIRNRLAPVPREDRAAGRLLRGAWHPPARRRQPVARRGRGADQGDARHPPQRGRGGHAEMYRGMIIRKTSEQIDADGGGGQDPGPLPADAAVEVPSRRHHHGARRGRREVHPLAGREAVVQGLPRLPGLDLHLAELDGRPRDPRPLRAAPRRHHLARRRGHLRGLGGRRGDHGADRRRSPEAREAAARDHHGRAVRAASSRRGPATTSATSRPRSSAGSSATASRSSAASSATGSAATCTRTRRSRTSASPARARRSSRAWSWRSSRWSTPAAPRSGWASDSWAVYSADGSLAAHFEFTVAVTQDGPRILTPWHLD